MPTTAPYSYVDYGVSGDLTSDQIAGTFSSVPLEVINTSDVSVVRTLSDGTKTTLSSSNFTVTESGTTINVVISGITPLNASDLIRISRTTSIGELTRNFTDGSVLKAGDLNEQNKQLLFSVQETSDGGIGSLPVDTDGKFDAGGKVIKNLTTGTNADDAVSKSYVDGLQLYGTGSSDPQAWSFTAAAGDVSGSNRQYTLETPTPSATNDSLYIVEVGGVIQTPSTYTVTESTGTYTLTLVGGAAGVADGDGIHVRNFGIARHILEQPVKASSATDPTLTIQRIGSQTSNLQEWVDEASTPNVLASIDKDGDASFVDVTASGAATVGGALSVTGNTTIGGTATITGTLNLVNGILQHNGVDTLNILQIVMATPPEHDSSSNYMGLGTTAKVLGSPVVITPKKATSTLIYFGHTLTVATANNSDIEGDDQTYPNRPGATAQVYKDGNTAFNETATGTVIDGSYRQFSAWEPNSEITTGGSGGLQAAYRAFASLDMIVAFTSGSTDEQKYSIGVKETSSDSYHAAYAYGGSPYTAAFIIEIG